MKNYIALFEQGENGGYSVIFPDVPGVISAGDDYDDAFRMAHEALAFHVEGLREDGIEVRSPRALERIKAEWDEWAEWESDGNFLVVPIALLPPQQRNAETPVAVSA